jgi:hypothetical protein
MKIKSVHPNNPPCNGEFEATIHKSTDNGLYVSIPGFGTSRTYYNTDEISAVENLLREHGAELELPCHYCGEWTPYLATLLCNWCWKVSSRVEDMPIDVINKITLEKSDDYEAFIGELGIELCCLTRMILVLQAMLLYPNNVEYRQPGGKWKIMHDSATIHQPGYSFRLRTRSPTTAIEYEGGRRDR